jgi:AraC-like DNA-binding protein
MGGHYLVLLMRTDCHLILQRAVLSPGGEWSPPTQGWVVAWVGNGVGYWMHGGQARELKDGDGFVVSGNQKMVVRASQLGILNLEYYLLQPPLLNGLLTVTEENKLVQVTSKSQVSVVFFTASDVLGQKIFRLIHQPQLGSLPSRAALVQFWAEAVAGLLLPQSLKEEGEGKLELRQQFLQLVTQMPNAELSRLSLSQLAGMLGCSDRHFRRIYLREFGVSLRVWQKESRLRRASQLLTDTNDKISTIAIESGYRNLGLFNAMFKRRFGFTPSAWRQRNLASLSSESKNSQQDAGAVVASNDMSATRREIPDENMGSIAKTKNL